MMQSLFSIHWKTFEESFLFSDCSHSLILSPLPSSFACHIPHYCTGVDCCIPSSVLGRNLHFYLEVNPCTSEIVVGVEKWVFREISIETQQLLSTGNFFFGIICNLSFLLSADSVIFAFKLYFLKSFESLRWPLAMTTDERPSSFVVNLLHWPPNCEIKNELFSVNG